MSQPVRLSVIIPFHNAERTLQRCLESVKQAISDDMEVLLIDDGSSDASPATATQYSFRLIRMPRCSGPAAARNRGAHEARGELLLFIDADVVLHDDTIDQILETYQQRIDIVGVSAIYSDKPLLSGLFQEFKTLEETYKYSAYRSQAYSGFDAHCASIKRDIFLELGGFNTSYTGADTEDLEFGHVLAKKYQNCINPAAVVDHHYASFWRGFWNYCRRSFYWAHVFVDRPIFDEAVTTRSNGISVLIACGSTAALFLAPWYTPFLWAAVVLAVTFVCWNARFVWLVVKRTRYRAIWLVPVFLLFMFSLQFAVGVGAFCGLIYATKRLLMRFSGTPRLEKK